MRAHKTKKNELGEGNNSGRFVMQKQMVSQKSHHSWINPKYLKIYSNKWSERKTGSRFILSLTWDRFIVFCLYQVYRRRRQNRLEIYKFIKYRTRWHRWSSQLKTRETIYISPHNWFIASTCVSPLFFIREKRIVFLQQHWQTHTK